MMQPDASLATLSAPFEASSDAVIVIDENDRILYANPAASRITGYPLDELVGSDAYGAMPPRACEAMSEAIRQHDATQPQGTILRGTSVLARREGGEFEIEYAAAPMVVDGRCLVAVLFHDVTGTRQLAREGEALTQIASQMAFAGSLEATLDKLAHSVVRATGTAACTVVLVEKEEQFRVWGSYGIPHDPDAQTRWEEANKRGAQIPGLVESVREKKPFICIGAREKALQAPIFAEPFFEPILRYFQDAPWDTVVAVPLISRGQAIGGLCVFYPRGTVPAETEIAFLTAIASQAAVAAENARLFGEVKEKAILEERHRLARELHDSVSQALYGIALGARTARTLLDRDPAQAAEPLDYVLSLAEAGLTEMRALIFELRPETLETEGLVAALTRQIDSARARHGLEVHLECSSEPDLPYAVKEAVYRIAQEALTNITKHARARRVDVRLADGPPELTLEVSDDGIGFASEDTFPGHLGLRSMRERAINVGGTVEVETAPLRGTRIRVRIPYTTGTLANLST
jgi:PAS domain S-box-containing protein